MQILHHRLPYLPPQLKPILKLVAPVCVYGSCCLLLVRNDPQGQYLWMIFLLNISVQILVEVPKWYDFDLWSSFTLLTCEVVCWITQTFICLNRYNIWCNLIQFFCSHEKHVSVRKKKERKLIESHTFPPKVLLWINKSNATLCA